MSDTSIVGDGSHDYGMENSSYRRRDTCWTRIGANICVILLIIIILVLAGVIAYPYIKLYLAAKKKKGKGQKNRQGVHLNSDETHGLINDMFAETVMEFSDELDDFMVD